MEKLDPVDAEQLVMLMRSPAYALVMERVDAEVGRQNRELVDVDLPEAKMYYKRGVISGLRMALSIPKILATEAGAEEKQERKKRR